MLINKLHFYKAWQKIKPKKKCKNDFKVKHFFKVFLSVLRKSHESVLSTLRKDFYFSNIISFASTGFCSTLQGNNQYN